MWHELGLVLSLNTIIEGGDTPDGTREVARQTLIAISPPPPTAAQQFEVGKQCVRVCGCTILQHCYDLAAQASLHISPSRLPSFMPNQLLLFCNSCCISTRVEARLQRVKSLLHFNKTKMY